MTTDPRIDAYIAAAAPFAQPILTELRARIHAACPAAVETIRWRAPTFTVNGRILCLVAAFKAHAAFSFWAKEMQAVLGADFAKSGEAMGSLGKLTSLADLPPRATLHGWLQTAAQLAATGAASRAALTKDKPVPPEPAELKAALAQPAHAAAAHHWAAFSNAKRRDYIAWITEAKQPATRARRLATTLEQLAEGKDRNWKYRDG